MAYWRGTGNPDDGPPAYRVSNEAARPLQEGRQVCEICPVNLGVDYVCPES